MATRTARSVAGRSSSTHPISSPSRTANFGSPPAEGAGLRLALARTGDHLAIHRLLLSVFQGPSLAEFHAQLDEPGYLPGDRLVVKDGEQVVAHLRLARQTIQLGSVALPAVRFMDMATAPEYRSRGLAAALVAAGERTARERGALVALARARVPSIFSRQGWSICGKHCFSSASPHAVLAELGATAAGAMHSEASQSTPELLRPRAERVVVRPLRRIELPAIARLYDENLANRFGWPVRAPAYWDWLLARAACDRIFVASVGPEQTDLDKVLSSIVGYAFVRQCRIVELVTAAGRDDVARHLVARACADAGEQDGWLVRCDLPPDHRLHALFLAAGGSRIQETSLGGEGFMSQLLDPLAVLRQMKDVWAQRARLGGIDKPVELGVDLQVAGGDRTGGVVDRYRLRISRGNVQIETGGPCRHTLVLPAAQIAPLLFGETSAEHLLSAKQGRATTRTAARLAMTLFPITHWWRPPLDDLLA